MKSPNIEELSDEQLLNHILNELDEIKDTQPERFERLLNRLISAAFPHT